MEGLRARRGNWLGSAERSKAADTASHGQTGCTWKCTPLRRYLRCSRALRSHSSAQPDGPFSHVSLRLHPAALHRLPAAQQKWTSALDRRRSGRRPVRMQIAKEGRWQATSDQGTARRGREAASGRGQPRDEGTVGPLPCTSKALGDRHSIHRSATKERTRQPKWRRNDNP